MDEEYHSTGNEGLVPEPIRMRKKKIGFEVPRQILVKAFKPTIDSVIERSTMINRYVNKDWLLVRIRESEFKDAVVWKMLCLVLWCKTFLER
jgi:hypothetical protein